MHVKRRQLDKQRFNHVDALHLRIRNYLYYNAVAPLLVTIVHGTWLIDRV